VPLFRKPNFLDQHSMSMHTNPLASKEGSMIKIPPISSDSGGKGTFSGIIIVE